MKKPFYILTLLFTAFSFLQCEEETPVESTASTLNAPEVLSTDFVEIVTLATTADFKIESVVTAWGEPLTSRGVCWNTTGSPTIGDEKTSDEKVAGELISSITGLNRGTTYYFRAYASNEGGIAYGKVISGETDPIPVLAEVTTNAATNIGQMNVTLSFTITSGTAINMAGVYISTNPTPTAGDENGDPGPIDGPGNYQVDLDNLTPGTLYYFRAFVTNEAGTALGNILQFTTENP